MLESERMKKSILAGIIISIASLQYVLIENHIISAIFFAFGLLCIFELKLNLFTGKAVDYNNYSCINFLEILLGNTIGCFIIFIISIFSNKGDVIYNTANQLCVNKFASSYSNLFFSAVLCGILMGIAVRINQNSINNVAKTYIIIMCITIFILTGGEHCIADISYVLFGKYLSIKTIAQLVIIIIGNFIGSVGINYLTKHN